MIGVVTLPYLAVRPIKIKGFEVVSTTTTISSVGLLQISTRP